MTRTLAVAVAVAVALACAVLAPAAAAAASGSSVEGACGTDTLVVLFWPRGHQAIAQLGLARTTGPHAVVLEHAGAGTFQPAYVVATATGRGGKLVARCTRVRDQAAVQALRPARTTSRPAAFTCRTRGDTLVQLRKLAGAEARWELRLIQPPDRFVLRVLLTPDGIGTNAASSLRRCRVGPAPPGTTP